MTDEEDSLPYAAVPVAQQFSVCVCCVFVRISLCVASAVSLWVG